MAKPIATDRRTNLAGIEKTINRLLLHGSATQSIPVDVVELLEKYNLLDSTDSPADQLWKAHLVVHMLKKGAQESLQAHDLELSAAGVEPGPICAFEAGNMIKIAIQKKDWQITKEAFLLLDATNQLLHPTALPAALDGLAAAYNLWPAWERVCGTRAHWLSPQREKWSWWHNLQSNQGTPVNLIIWHSLRQNLIDETLFPSTKAKDVRVYFKFLAQQPLLANKDLLNPLYDHILGVQR